MESAVSRLSGRRPFSAAMRNVSKYDGLVVTLRARGGGSFAILAALDRIGPSPLRSPGRESDIAATLRPAAPECARGMSPRSGSVGLLGVGAGGQADAHGHDVGGLDADVRTVAFSTPFVISADVPSNRQASATSNTTRPQAMRPIASPVPVRPPSRSSASSEGREARIAAGSPAISVDRNARRRRGRHAEVDLVRPPVRGAVLRLSIAMRKPSRAMDDSSRPSSVASMLMTSPRPACAARGGRARRRAPSAPWFRARDRPSARAAGSRRWRRRSAARSRPRPAWSR